MFKKHTITFAATIGIAISTFALTSTDNPNTPLEENEEYQSLMAESDRLVIMNDSINDLLIQTRADMRLYIDTVTTEPSRDYIYQYNQRIVELESEIFNITQKQGEIASRINELEMKAIEEQFNTSFGTIMGDIEEKKEESVEDNTTNNEESTETKTEDVTTPSENVDNTTSENEVNTPIEVPEQSTTTEEQSEVTTEQTETTPEEQSEVTTEQTETTPEEQSEATDEQPEVTEEQPEKVTPMPRRNIIDDERFIKSLNEKDFEDLCNTQIEESNVEKLCNEYIELYSTIRELDAAYAKAKNQAEADSIYAVYADAIATLNELNTQIGQKWNFVIDTKYYAYGYVIEKERNKSLLNKLDTDFSTMLQQCANNDDCYASNGVMRYAIGRPAVLDFEIALSHEFGLTAAADSLSVVRQEFVAPNYQLSPVELPEQRLFIDYQDITFGRTNYYNSTNPLPEVKVYERGTIYRILLGVFKSRQPMTLFKGVHPLYIETDASGLNHYYAGGFATLEEAEAAQKLLYDKGFKAPEICRWMNGTMTNLTAGSGTSTGNESISAGAKRYMLCVAEQDMTAELKQRISALHPNKSVTLTRDGYVIGSFEGHDEVTRLFITLSDEFSVNLEILEVEIK